MADYLNSLIKTFGDQFGNFIKFLFEKNIFQTGLAFILATQVNKLFLDFLAGIITPVTEKIVSSEIKQKTTEVFGIKFQTGLILLSTINFMIVMFFLYYLYKISDSSKTLFENIYSKVTNIF